MFVSQYVICTINRFYSVISPISYFYRTGTLSLDNSLRKTDKDYIHNTYIKALLHNLHIKQEKNNK